MANHSAGVAHHAEAVLRGEVRTGLAAKESDDVVLDVPGDSDFDSDTDDEFFSFVPVPTGETITPKMWAAYAKQQQEHEAQLKVKEAKRKAKRDKRKKKEGGKQEFFGKQRASASGAHDRRVVINGAAVKTGEVKSFSRHFIFDISGKHSFGIND